MISYRTAFEQLVLSFNAISTMAVEDPALLAIQIARRLPSSVTSPLATIVEQLGSPTTQPLAALLKQDLGHASALIDHRVCTRIDAEILALAGLDPGIKWEKAYVRWLWNTGRGLEAIEHANGALRQRLKGIAVTQLPGFKLPINELPHRTYSIPRNDPRVLHVLTNSLPHTQSGYSLRTHHSLIALQRLGVSVVGVTRLGYPLTIGRLVSSPEETVDSVTYKRLLGTSWPHTVSARLLEQASQLVRTANEWKPNILHTTTDYRNALVTAAIAQRLNIPWIYEMRGELESTWLSKVPVQYRDQAETSWHYRTLHNKELEMAKTADHVVTLSHVQRNLLIKRGVPAQHVSVVPNAVPEERIGRQYSKIEARRIVGLTTPLPVFGSVSSVVDYEGFDTALRALRQLLNTGYECLFALVGDGAALPHLRRLADELNVTPFVRFIGRVSAEEATTWYHALDCFVIPRKDTPVCRRVTPLKGLEAAAINTPLVISDLPALVEVTSSDSTSVVGPSDISGWATAIRRCLMTSSERLESKSTFTHTLSYAANARRYLRIYSDLLERI